MIRYFRDHIQGGFAKIFIALICVPFVLYGVDSLFSSSQNPNVAKVNGESIKSAETQNEIQRLLTQRKQQLGDAFDAANFDQQSLQPQAVGRLVKRKVFEQAVQDQNLVVSAKEIDKKIVTQTLFQSEGEFSAGLYKNILRANNLSPRAYKILIEQELAVKQLSTAISSSQFVTAIELDNYIRFEYQSRDIAYFVFDAKLESDNTQVSTEQVSAYYDDNSAEFMTDETVNVDYVELKLEDYFQPVSEQDVLQAYEQQIADMVLPTQRKAAHILISDKDDGLAILGSIKQRLDAGEDFAVLAAEVSQDQGSANNGGELGYTGGELFPAEFEAALAALALNEVSEPVTTDAGIHLIKLLDEKTGDTPRLEDLRAGLTAELQKLQALPDFEEALERLKDLAFDSGSINDVATELSIEVQRSGQFSEAGANSGLFAAAGLVAMAFSNDVRIDKRISDVREITAEHYLVAQLNGRKLPEQKSLATVTTGIEQRLKSDAVRSALVEKAAAANNALLEGQSLDDIATTYGLSVTTAEAVTRREMPDTDRDVIFAGFNVNSAKLPAHDSYTRNDGSIAVLSVSKVNYGNQQDVDEQTKTSLGMLLSRSYGNEAFNRYDAALNEVATIKLL